MSEANIAATSCNMAIAGCEPQRGGLGCVVAIREKSRISLDFGLIETIKLSYP